MPARSLESALGTLAQLTQGVIGLALLLVAHEAHLDVTTAALAVSAYAVGMSVGRPLQGRALDRMRALPVLVGCGAAHGAAYGVIAVAAHERWGAVYVLGALLAGLTLPPIATQMRAAWPAREPASGAARVFAAITALQTVSVLLAPLLFTAVDVIGSATDAMLTVAGVSVVCTVLFGLTCRDPVRAQQSDRRVRLRRYAIPLVMTGLLGSVVGTLEVCAPAIAIGARPSGRGRSAGGDVDDRHAGRFGIRDAPPVPASARAGTAGHRCGRAARPGLARPHRAGPVRARRGVHSGALRAVGRGVASRRWHR